MSEAASGRMYAPQMARAPGDVAGRIRDVIVQDLTKDERLLLLLWHAEAMTPQEIGQVLHTSAAQIRTMHDRAIARVRELVCLDRATPTTC